MSWLQVYADEGAANGSYIITGSHQLEIQSAISQSLAGRTSVLTLLPLSILEASFIIFRLPPYYNNFGKRLIKANKLYFTEIGLAAWLLGIESPEQMMRDPLYGQLFENLVVLEALKARYNTGREPNLYFWRDSNQNEVDLLIDYQRRLYPVEIKSARTWQSDFKNNIIKFQKAVPVAERGTIVYGGEEHFSFDNFDVVPFRDAFPLDVK